MDVLNQEINDLIPNFLASLLFFFPNLFMMFFPNAPFIRWIVYFYNWVFIFAMISMLSNFRFERQ